MAWIAYKLPPLDYGWEHLATAQDVAAKLAATEISDLLDRATPAWSIADFVTDLTNACELARTKGWEGDFRLRAEPRVLWLPIVRRGSLSRGFEYAFVWKQENDGTTFVISPVQLPWLDDL